ncbi:TetR/AcrR family transcriptional regulator [Pseudoteredinibacter isoporae]|uniref:AcrR family transcriptional regulator n=1 Tax=Pseudoteredinibacter isoporae TaxID=570281 RepID=A0A7X0JSD1_9GAMM|nr:TetR/AcrR family transcriptional regulator [Pseudoteredinibacter isoporae]MBB6520446.1 AcrR family transcriptional regulator [Pseudoteredinibacter isoporae]NHO86013.1 TetR/AcrR family transcriptional regulator [Pseudoteredinibacter isoporae]NIB25536.1 TetR/AcrR family transcriptional regulator [Pseudoteredinibacter isoporae]
MNSEPDNKPKAYGQKAKQTRQRILQAAAQELAERGGELEIASVATTAQVSSGLIYRYFSSRTDLIAAVVDDFYDQYDQWIIDINPLPGADWLSRERARVERSISFIRKHPLAKVVFLNRQKEPLVAAVESRRLAAHLQLAIENVLLAQSRGEIDKNIGAYVACPMVMGGIRELMVQLLSNSPHLTSDSTQLLDQTMAFIARAMGLPNRKQSS